tara:strand:+ start:205 stop:585 length:381 start_codon:yes stop_codon:yes gene_type:complete
MLQLILHLIGDYLLQSDWMALNKTKCSKAAAAHAVTYSLPFLLICPSAEAFLVICITHFFIDRFRLARYVVFAKSRLGPKRYWHKWEDCKETGYHKDVPQWLSLWLLVACDNTIHLLINFLALEYL